MPISVFKPIEILQREYHNQLSWRDKEDRLHSELRGEEYEFTVEEDGEPKDLELSIENIGLDQGDSVNLGLRLHGFECRTSLGELHDDLRFLYTYAFLRGRGSASELADPLMAELNVAGFSRHEVRISMWVSTTLQSGIWDAVGRIALIIAHYHSEWFQSLKEIEQKYADQYDGDPENIPMGAAVPIVESLENYNIFNAYSMLIDYMESCSDEEDGDFFDLPEEIEA